MKAIMPNCPVCDSEMHKSDLPKHSIYVCTQCQEIAQVQEDGQIVLMGDLLSRCELGDDSVMAAISKPHIANLGSFTEAFSSMAGRHSLEQAEALGSARAVQAQICNRAEFVLGELAGLDLVSDAGGEILQAVREILELSGSGPSEKKGIKEVSHGAIS